MVSASEVKQAAEFVSLSLIHFWRFDHGALQHRGQEGAGIVANQQGHLWQERGLGLLHDVFRDPARLAHLQGQAAIGHVRYATAGSAGIENIQPLMVFLTKLLKLMVVVI